MRCGHCGFEGDLEQQAQVAVAREGDDADGYGSILWTRYWTLYSCPVCHEATLTDIWWSDDVSDPEDRATVVYPTERDNSAVPEKVRKRYEAMLKVKKIEPGLYAVGVRRMLETVANDQGAVGKDLFDKLDDLVNKGRIPASLANAAHELRKLGNLGAHDEDVEVEAQDVPLIEALAEAILEFLYRAPATVVAVQDGLKERKR